MKHLNIETVGWSKTLLNNRLLLKGITFAKMCDTFWQEPFYIKMRIRSIITPITSAKILFMNMQELMRMRGFRELTQRRGMNLSA